MKKILITISMVIFGNLLNGQIINSKNIEPEIINNFVKYWQADYNIRFDSLRPLLKSNFEQTFSRPETFEFAFDSLGQYIEIIKSKDNRIRIFSWDEMTGGTWHDMAVFVQYKSKTGKIKTQWIDSDINEEQGGLTDAIQYEIFDVKIKNQPHYLCFGSGTYGSGHYHNSILILTLKNNSLKVCSKCIEKEYSLIMAPRVEDIDLKYDEDEKVISFNEFIYDYESGFYRSTGKRIKIKLINNKYQKFDG